MSMTITKFVENSVSTRYIEPPYLLQRNESLSDIDEQKEHTPPANNNKENNNKKKLINIDEEREMTPTKPIILQIAGFNQANNNNIDKSQSYGIREPKPEKILIPCENRFCIFYLKKWNVSDNCDGTEDKIKQ